MPGVLVFCFRPLLPSSIPKPLSGGSHWTLVSESSSVYYTAGPHPLAEPTPALSTPAAPPSPPADVAPPSPQQTCPPRPRISSFRTGFRSKKKSSLHAWLYIPWLLPYWTEKENCTRGYLGPFMVVTYFESSRKLWRKS